MSENQNCPKCGGEVHGKTYEAQNQSGDFAMNLYVITCNCGWESEAGFGTAEEAIEHWDQIQRVEQKCPECGADMRVFRCSGGGFEYDEQGEPIREIHDPLTYQVGCMVCKFHDNTPFDSEEAALEAWHG